MANRLFKRLFEVSILHGYYLDHAVWDVTQVPKIFQDYSPEEQEEALLHYDIRGDISIEPTPGTQILFKGLHMRWAISPQGVFAGMEVERIAQDRYKPFITLPAQTKWTFIVRVRNPYLYNFSNHSLRPTIPGIYYFTNHPTVTGKSAPVLSTLPPLFEANRFWEMGELVRDNTGQILRAPHRTDQIGQFAAFPNHHWANTADRVALPKAFTYRFDTKVAVQNAVFRLLDSGGTALKTIQKQFATAPETLRVDFGALDKLPNEISPKPIKDGWYDLEVVLNGAVFERRPVMLRSDLPNDASVFALIEIVHHATQDGFQLLNADNTLRYAPNPNDPQKIDPLKFQIHMLPRATYWQYQIERFASSTLPATNKSYGAVNYMKDSHMLVSAEPRALTRIRTPLKVKNDVYLPNPERPDLQFDQSTGKFISQLFLQTIKLS